MHCHQMTEANKKNKTCKHTEPGSLSLRSGRCKPGELQAEFAFALPSFCQVTTSSCIAEQFSTATEQRKFFYWLHACLSTVGPEEKGPCAFSSQAALPLSLTSSVSRGVPLLPGCSASNKTHPWGRRLLPLFENTGTKSCICQCKTHFPILQQPCV